MEGSVRKGDVRGGLGRGPAGVGEPQGVDGACRAFSLADIVVCRMRDLRATSGTGQLQGFRKYFLKTLLLRYPLTVLCTQLKCPIYSQIRATITTVDFRIFS